ncbi:putative polyketide synthase [Hypoxylon argillaceum]|nr:putative polyketide synthase [Hypoxylon argillaceum]
MWNFMVRNESAQGPVPAQRFNMKGFHHMDDNRAGVMSADGGYFIDGDVRDFDNNFFGINNLEATYMDPHQRKLLEVVYECLENANLSVEDVHGKNVGVYVGTFTVDFTNIHFRDPDYLHRYSSTGSNMSIIANRISHVFNLRGPSLTINTACSSSLYCIHSALSGIANGDCEAAIVAGINLIFSPEQHLETMKGGVLSPTSRCHTFDESADGYGRGEAVNAVYLKRLSSATRCGDHIYGIIHATAVNSNGRTPGIVQPSVDGQEAVIRKSYSRASLEFSETDYVECHGTGTAIGDKVEIQALGRCFARREAAPLLVGSVKTHFGHSEAASGLTSLIKVLLAFENDQIPPTFGLTNPNPNLPLDAYNMKVVTEVTPWPRAIRRASVNSFGYGGANSHAILESLHSYLGQSEIPKDIRIDFTANSIVIPISAKSRGSLENRMRQISEMIQDPTLSIFSLAQTAAHEASKFEMKEFMMIENGKCQEPELSYSPSSTRARLLVCFVFTGQGAQYKKMARVLRLESPVFASVIGRLDLALGKLAPEIAPSWSLKEAIDGYIKQDINQPLYSQSLCTAIQIGLVDVLESWGITPSIVIGHSSGEIAAAYAAKRLTADQAITLAYLRGYAVANSKRSGAMVAASIEAEEAQKIIDKLGLQGEVCIACYNAPGNVTLSGESDGISLITAEIRNLQKHVRSLNTGGKAYHSHMMLEIGQKYEDLIAPVFKGQSSERDLLIPMISSTSEACHHASISDEETGSTARYWRRNLECPVRFQHALEALLAQAEYHIIEIGPHHALRSPIRQTLGALNKSHLPYMTTLDRNSNDDLNMKRLAGHMFICGHELNWSRVNLIPSGTSMLRNMPHYPWDYQFNKLLWHEPRSSIELRGREYIRHELLGSKQLAGSGIHTSWRNIVCLDELPWLSHHKLETKTVFPAAAYVSMAVEAICQIRAIRPGFTDVGFELRNISMNTALVFEEKDQVDRQDVELHTTMSPTKISATKSSHEWHDFTVSSWIEGISTTRCSGRIRCGGAIHVNNLTPVSSEVSYEISSMDNWYDRLAECGLVFGPIFRTIKTLSVVPNNELGLAIATTNLQTPDKLGISYTLHPIDIDAGIQAAALSGSRGDLSVLRAHLPVFIEECQLRVSVGNQAQATIHTNSVRTSVSGITSAFIMRNSDDVPVLSMTGIRMKEYRGKTKTTEKLENHNQSERHPCLRVNWKPDIMRLCSSPTECVIEYINEYSKRQADDIADDRTGAIFGCLLDLAGHKYPGMRVLVVNDDSGFRSKIWKNILDSNSSFTRYSEWTTARVLGNRTIDLDDKASFDLLVIPSYADSLVCWRDCASHILPKINRGRGIVLCRKSNEAMQVFKEAGFGTVEVGHNVILATRHIDTCNLQNSQVLIIHREHSPAAQSFMTTLSNYLEEAGAREVKSVILAQAAEVEIDDSTICLSLLELEQEFLASMDQLDMELLRGVTNNIKNIVWLTGGNFLEQSNPSLAMCKGLSRALMLEQPSLRFCNLDVSLSEDLGRNQYTTYRNVLPILIPRDSGDDKEFTQSGGLLYISRFYACNSLNKLFNRRISPRDAKNIMKKSLGSAGVARMIIGQPGILESIHFKPVCDPASDIPPGYVDVRLKAVSLNAKDIYIMHGKTETRDATLCCEFAGVVVGVASDVSTFLPGDRVVALIPNHLTLTERVPAWTLCKLLPDEEFTTMSTIPVVYTTALYALRERAQLRKGESVLIHSGAGGLGLAAIDVAQSIGAFVYTTVGSHAKKRFLMSHFNLPASRIFSSRDNSFVEGIFKATKGRGVDVILNSLTGDIMHATWSCIAEFGRFVEVGKLELLEAGHLDMAIFKRGVSFSAFDLSDFLYSQNQYYTSTAIQTLHDVIEWYRSERIRPRRVQVYDVSEITAAYRFFSSRDRIGKVVVSFENPQSQIRVSEPTYRYTFDPEKGYLLVGGLGGLGRSIGNWMAKRGARRLSFLGRAGGDSDNAQKMISRLRGQGIDVSVIKGDVRSASDVRKAVDACSSAPKGVGGVIHAAMGLQASLFSEMTNDAWHKGIDAKWAGAWNLHAALEGHDKHLDFFLLTSSVNGTIGSATEANYCASNSFLDAFARWRREQGKRAISIGLGMISEVGYLHENPAVEQILLRKGIHPLTEHEFLQIIDLALTTDDQDALEGAHLLTGLESLGFRTLKSQGFDVNRLQMLDPRSGILAQALETELLHLGQGQANVQNHYISNTAAWAQGLPQTILKTFQHEMAASSLPEAILSVIGKQFSTLTLTPLSRVEYDKSLSQQGVDSMIAAEFRTWFWTALEIDIPFLDLLSDRQSLSSLAIGVETKLADIHRCADKSKALV